ncbi:hypothetical protein K469DRAFT_772915 [Zopfia rhizophila CBS 207.26]|uniref:DUF7708 domain-containing protein n=1 Tax=Zopfia rhizophila CBS 207.26 TaxID=1314779 RepID=A0A6A6E902_9PEZI|nr:hypothetical protein K469DRAFT_772915 [Zopfia rhizophila CBS 207.26]
MDVFLPHHPEYIAIAWDAMKLLFGTIVEHERLGITIVTGLCDIADALPRMELAGIIYPTSMMTQTIAMSYARIISFLIRALDWYEEDLTIARSQVEQKDMHHQLHNVAKQGDRDYQLLRTLKAAVKQIQESIASAQTLNDSTHLAVRHKLSEIQLTQALSIVGLACGLDHKSCLQASFLLRDEHKSDRG